MMDRPPRCQHIALKARDLESSFSFYAGTLGLEVANYDRELRILALRLADGFILRFDATDQPIQCEGLSFIGIELQDFQEVDLWHQRLRDRVPVVQDLREKYRDHQGPYGFILRDPDGYRLKLFRYNLG